MFRDLIHQPKVDVPSLSVRWEGLVVVLDTTTLNTVLRRAVRRVPEVRDIGVEAENGRLGLMIKLRKVVSVPLRADVTSIRMKDGFLGFVLEHVKAFGFLPVPDALLRKIVEHLPEGLAWFYPGDRVFVVDLTSVLPPELSLQVREVICEGGEIRVVFGPSQFRLDRLMEELDRDPFAED